MMNSSTLASSSSSPLQGRASTCTTCHYLQKLCDPATCVYRDEVEGELDVFRKLIEKRIDTVSDRDELRRSINSVKRKMEVLPNYRPTLSTIIGTKAFRAIVSEIQRTTMDYVFDLSHARLQIASLNDLIMLQHSQLTSNSKKRRLELENKETRGRTDDEYSCEKEDLIRAFQVFDDDGSGFISVEQLRNVMKSKQFYEVEVDDIISYAIMDDDDRIDYVDLANFIASHGLQLIRETASSSQSC